MADNRTFTLIGSFTDGITPSLEKINESINSLKTNLAGFGARRGGFNDLTKSMGKVIGAHKLLSEEVRTLRKELTDSIPVLREYRKEVGKTVGANMMLQGKGKKQKFTKSTNPTLQFLDEATRRTRDLAQASRGVTLGGRIPRGGGRGGGGGGGGYIPRTPRPPRIPSDDGGGGYSPAPRSTFGTKKFGVSRDETFAFGQTLGFTLGSTITGAITQGFMIGVGLMTKPFEMFAGALQERVQDELSDISAAGGLLSVAKRQKGEPLVKSFQDSMELTQLTNKYMAEIAAALPGNTQQYIEVGKRMSDTVARMISADPAKAMAYARELADKKGEGRVISTQKDAYTQIVGNMATQGVLAGMGDGGGGTGARGLMGAYGLPQLMERMMNDQEVSMGQFQRYAAIFRDPKIMDALERYIPKVNATMKGTVDRARVFDKFFEEVLPPEMIRAFERSSAGIMEAFKTAFIGPETGLLGLGRKFEGMGKKMDDYGRYLDAKGTVTDFTGAVDASLSLFDMLRDIFANISITLYPLVEILPQIFDPLKNISKLLVDARHISGQFLLSFEEYLAGMDQLAKTTMKGNKDFMKTKRARAGLLAITNFLTDVGAFSKSQFTSMSFDIINKPSAQLGEILNGILTTFFESTVAYDLGNIIGSLIGTTLKQVATMIEYFLGIAESSQIASGLKDGFSQAGGYEAFRSIIQNVFKALFKAAFEIFKLAPVEFSILGSIALLLPAFVSSFSIMMANWIEAGLEGAASKYGKMLKAPDFAAAKEIYKLDKAKPKITGDLLPESRKGSVASHLKSFPRKRIVNKQFPHLALGTHEPMSIGRSYRAPSVPKPAGSKAVPVTIKSVAKNALGKTKNFVKGLPGGIDTAGLKNPIGMLGKFGSALTALTGIISGVEAALEGGDIWKVLGATAGPVIGTILGTALLPFLGPLGGIIGGWIGQQKSVGEGLGNIFRDLASTAETLGQLLITMGTDIGWVVSKLFGLGDDFDYLRVLMKMLEAPFYFMKIGMMGIYAAYLRLNPLRKAEADAVDKQILMTQFEAQAADKAYNTEQYLKTDKNATPKSISDAIARFKGDLEVAKKANNLEDIANAKAQLKVYQEKLAELTKKPGTPGAATPPKPGAPGAATPPKPGTPAAAAAEAAATAKNPAAEAAKQTAASIQQISQKASAQLKQTAAVKTSTDKTTAAVKELTAKTTSASSLQTSVASIYNLLASGMLRVQTNMTGMMMPGTGERPGPTPITGVGTPYIPGVENIQWGTPPPANPPKTKYAGGLGDAISKEMKMKPPGSGLVIANSSETVIPAAGGYGMKDFMGYLRSGFDRMATIIPRAVQMGSMGNSSYGGSGGNTFGNINVTVNAGATTDPDALASIVALKIGEAVADARASSVFV